MNSAIGHFTSDIYKLALIKPASVGAHGHRIDQRRVFQLTQQATRDVKFKLSLES